MHCSVLLPIWGKKGTLYCLKSKTEYKSPPPPSPCNFPNRNPHLTSSTPYTCIQTKPTAPLSLNSNWFVRLTAPKIKLIFCWYCIVVLSIDRRNGSFMSLILHMCVLSCIHVQPVPGHTVIIAITSRLLQYSASEKYVIVIYFLALNNIFFTASHYLLMHISLLHVTASSCKVWGQTHCNPHTWGWNRSRAAQSCQRGFQVG